ncbi:MAG: TonB-dependent receptor [Bacteroidota bacterium]
MRKRGPLIIILQFIALVSFAQAETSSGEITVNENDITLEAVLDMISEQAGVNFSYNPQYIDPQQRLSLSVKKASLSRVLSILEKKVNAEFKVIDDFVIINLSENPVTDGTPLTLSGFISDESTGEVLIGATVGVSGTSRGVFTNAFGFYSIQLKPGKYTLSYSYIGYENKEVAVDLSKNEQQDMTLGALPIDLPDVTIGIPLRNLLDKKEPSAPEMSPEALQSMPEFAGESGLVKGLQSLPGVSMHSDGSAFFYVRGGERDQNVVIIDDAPIYNPSHLFGFYSLIIPDFTKSITVYKSDMPADLGDRLSSIVSIRTKDGNINKFGFSGAINPIMYRFSVDAPFVKKRGSIFVSFRRSNYEWLYKRSQPESRVFFYDLNFKWNHKINDKNRIYFTTIIAGDNFGSRGDNGAESGIKWGNSAATFRWNHIFGPKLFSNTTIYTGNYAYRIFSTQDFWLSGLSTLSLKSDFTHYTSSQITSKFGIEAQAYFINPSEISLDTDLPIFPDIKPNYSRKLTLYYQGTFGLSEKLTLNAGLRVINWANTGPVTYFDFDENFEVSDTLSVGNGVYHNYLRAAPRLSLQYEINDYSRLKLNVGLYQQYLQVASNSGSPFTSMEVWVPAGPNIKPQSALHLGLSYLNYFERPNMEFSASAYYKHSENQIDYKPHAETLLNPLLDGDLRFGTLRSYGLEMMLKKNTGKLNGWISYTLSRAIKNTPDLNNGEDYLAFQDRPHELSLLLNYHFGPKVRFTGYWTIFSGARFSSPTGFFNFNDQTIPIYGEKNNDRLPAYSRFDLSFNFILNKKLDSKFQHDLTFSIYNATAHKNIVKLNFNKIPVEGDRPIVPINRLAINTLIASQTDFIRFFPSLTYKFKL